MQKFTLFMKNYVQVVLEDFFLIPIHYNTFKLGTNPTYLTISLYLWFRIIVGK
jgi:hypothetical protein